MAETPEDDLALCRRAIELYLNVLNAKDGLVEAGIAAKNRERAGRDAEQLAKHGNRGVELGAPGNAMVSLKYCRGCFSISRGNESDRHRRWEDHIGAKFTEAGLPFNYHFRAP